MILIGHIIIKDALFIFSVIIVGSTRTQNRPSVEGEEELLIKELCKLKKHELAAHLEKIIKITKKPKFICTKCARVAKEKKYLCDPEKM